MPLNRRSPYPADVVADGTQLMLLRPDPKSGNAPLVSSRLPTPGDQMPGETGMNDSNPRLGKDHIWDDLSLGFGQRIQIQQHDRRYSYAEGVDSSSAGMTQLGPKLHRMMPDKMDALHGITRFAEIDGIIYAINGQYLHKIDPVSMGVTTAKDFGGGNAALDLAMFQPNDDGPQRLYIAMGDTVAAWIYSGTIGFVQSGTAATDYTAAFYARAWGKASTYFFIGTDNNAVAWVDYNADPGVPANWSAQYTIGDSSQPINRFATTSQAGLLILKPDGMYTLDQAQIDHPLFSALGQAPVANGGMAVAQFGNDVYVAYGAKFGRVSPNYGYEDIGPERLLDNDSPIKGWITACCAHGNFALYAGAYNPDTDTCYLLKFASWLQLKDPPDWIAPQSTLPIKVEAWNGSLIEGITGKTITAMHESSIGATDDHTLMYLGFSDGTYGYFTLPCSPNPANCSDYEYANQGYLYYSRWHGMLQNESKALAEVTVAGKTFSPDQSIQFIYRTDQLLTRPVGASVNTGDLSTYADFGTTEDLHIPHRPSNHVYSDLNAYLYSQMGPSGATDTPPLTGTTDHLWTYLGQIGPTYGTYQTMQGLTYTEINGVTYDLLSTIQQGATPFEEDPRQTREFGYPTDGSILDGVLLLKGGGIATTPIVSQVALTYTVTPKLKLVYEMIVNASTYAVKRDGSRLRQNVDAIRAKIFSLAKPGTPVEWRLPDSSKVMLKVIDYAEVMGWDERLSTWTAGLKILCGQFGSTAAPDVAVYGTYERLGLQTYSYWNGKPYTLLQLA